MGEITVKINDIRRLAIKKFFVTTMKVFFGLRFLQLPLRMSVFVKYLRV